MRALRLGGASCLAPRRRFVPRALRLDDVLRLGDAPRMAPWRLALRRRFALGASAALRASPLGSASALGDTIRLTPRRRLAVRALEVPRDLRCLASRASAALCTLRLDGARAPGVLTVPADPGELGVQADSTTPALWRPFCTAMTFTSVDRPSVARRRSLVLGVRR